MSTLAMKNYGLVLPKNYVSINEEEMRYIDGGVSAQWNWWGLRLIMSPGEAKTYLFLGNDFYGAAISGAIGCCGGGPAAVVLGLFFMINGRLISNTISTAEYFNKNLNFDLNWATLSSMNPSGVNVSVRW